MKKQWKVSQIPALLALLPLLTLMPLTCVAEEHVWTVTTKDDFHEGVLNETDSWSTPGSIQLDRRWKVTEQVNSSSSNSRDLPRLAGKADTMFCVWEDERIQDHNPDIYLNSYDTSVGIWNGEKILTSHIPDYRRKNPDIAVRTSDGNLFVAFQLDSGDSAGDGDIEYVYSADNGVSWSPPLTICNDSGNQITPRISEDKSSGSPLLYTVWEDQVTDDGDIFVSRYASGVWSATPFKISDGTNNRRQQSPDIATDSSGNVFVVWHDTRNNDDGEIYFSSFLNGASWNADNWSSNIRLNDDTPEYALTSPSITTGEDNAIYVTWAERVSTGPATYDFQIQLGKSEDNGVTWSTTVVDRLQDASAGNNSYEVPTVGVDSDGKIYVVWMYDIGQQAADGYLLTSISADGGNTWTTPKRISGPSQNVRSTTTPALDISASDRVVVAWDDYRNTYPDIYSTVYPGLGYNLTGSYSKILESEKQARWGTITWSESLPAGTTLTLQSRVKNSEDDAWGSWLSHGTNGEDVEHNPARFLQFKATLGTSTPAATPLFSELVLTYETCNLFLFLPAISSGAN